MLGIGFSVHIVLVFTAANCGRWHRVTLKTCALHGKKAFGWSGIYHHQCIAIYYRLFAIVYLCLMKFVGARLTLCEPAYHTSLVLFVRLRLTVSTLPAANRRSVWMLCFAPRGITPLLIIFCMLHLLIFLICSFGVQWMKLSCELLVFCPSWLKLETILTCFLNSFCLDLSWTTSLLLSAHASLCNWFLI